jgi:HK97 family phage major capsid protein
MDDTANAGSWLAEAAPVNQTNPTFSNITLGANLLSSDAVLISVQLLQDSAFSMESELAQAFGVRLGRGTSAAYTLGSGSGQPMGLIPALTAAGGRAVTCLGANSNSGNAGDTDLNSVGTDDFANLIAKVDVSYRQGYECSFLANQATLDAQRNRKDKYGRPVWEVSLAQGDPDRIFGFSYGYDNSLPVVGANAVGVIVFGAFKKYIIRDVLGMTVVRYNELYMPNHQIGFEAFLRTDGQLLQPKAFSMLNCPAS